MDLVKADKRLSGIVKELNFYRLLTPLNKKMQKALFFSALTEGRRYEPRYEYPKSDLSRLRKNLKELKNSLRSGSGLEGLLSQKAEFFLKGMDLIESDDARFPEVARELWGVAKEEVLSLAEKELSALKENEYKFPEEPVTPLEMKEVLTEKLEEEGLFLWRATLSDKIVPKITICSRERTIYINPDFNYSVAEVERLKVHEVEVHVFRGENGFKQPYRIFSEGFASYGVTEEGLALFAEKDKGVWRKDTRQIKLYAGRALSSDLALDKGFFDTFECLREYFTDEIAFRLTERCKRGLCDTSKPGGVNKGFHYLEGYMKIKRYCLAGGDMKVLFTGKVSLEDAEILSEMLQANELRWPAHFIEFNTRTERG